MLELGLEEHRVHGRLFYRLYFCTGPPPSSLTSKQYIVQLLTLPANTIHLHPLCSPANPPFPSILSAFQTDSKSGLVSWVTSLEQRALDCQPLPLFHPYNQSMLSINAISIKANMQLIIVLSVAVAILSCTYSNST